MAILDDGPYPSAFTAGGILDQFTPDDRFADENGDVPSFRPEPEPPGRSAEEWEQLDRLTDEWVARHEGPDVVQDLPSWLADRETDASHDDEAEL